MRCNYSLMALQDWYKINLYKLALTKPRYESVKVQHRLLHRSKLSAFVKMQLICPQLFGQVNTTWAQQAFASDANGGHSWQIFK